MRVLAHKNLNLHLGSGKLVHVKKGQVHEVPDDVQNGANFDLLVNSGAIVILKDTAVDTSDTDAEIARMLKDYPNHQAEIEDARISGSPLHLVAAKIAAQEKANQASPAEVINTGVATSTEDAAKDEDEDLDEDEDDEDEEDE
jgi:hypothetical protein